MRYIFILFFAVFGAMASVAEEGDYCSGPGCGDAAPATFTPPPSIMYSFYMQYMLRDLGQKYPDQTVSPETFANNETLQIDLHDAVNILLFLDPYTVNLGLQPSEFVPPGTPLPTGPAMSDSPADPLSPLEFSYFTPEDYKGFLVNMLDDIIVRYPDRTIPAGSLPTSGTLDVPLYQIANLLIFFDDHLDDRGWTPSVF